MNAGATFAEVDRRAAGNFARAAVRAGVRQIIYLGGLTGDCESLSPPLKSRADTGAVLRASGIPLMLPVPMLTPHLSGLWLALVTPAQARVGRALVEGLKNATVVRSTAAAETFGVAPVRLRSAIVTAIEGGAGARRKEDVRTVIADVPPAQAFAPVRRIGGVTGWYFGDALWKARGWLDRCFGGVGMRRGRRDPDSCAVGATIDGWTVEAYEPDRRLRLSADFKLPGRATSWAGEPRMTHGRSGDGGRPRVTWQPFESTANKGTSSAAADSGRPCCTGRTTAGRFELMPPRARGTAMSRGLPFDKNVSQCAHEDDLHP